MKEAFGNIWDHLDEFDGLVITTNGAYKSNGDAVMGRGIALQAASRYSWLPANLGSQLRLRGNRVFRFDVLPSFERGQEYNFSIYTFPVKPRFGPRGEPGWMAKADIGLIRESAFELVELVDEYRFREDYRVVLPRPGCGNGGLRWEDVQPVIDPILDDRFTVMERA